MRFSGDWLDQLDNLVVKLFTVHCFIWFYSELLFQFLSGISANDIQIRGWSLWILQWCYRAQLICRQRLGLIIPLGFWLDSSFVSLFSLFRSPGRAFNVAMVVEAYESTISRMVWIWDQPLMNRLEFWMRRNNFRWWSKFNFLLSAGLDSGTVLSGLFIFFVLQLPLGGTISESSHHFTCLSSRI